MILIGLIIIAVIISFSVGYRVAGLYRGKWQQALRTIESLEDGEDVARIEEPKPKKKGEEWTVASRDAPEQNRPSIYLVRLIRGDNYMEVGQLDIKHENFKEDLSAMVDKAQDRADALNDAETRGAYYKGN